MNKKFVICIKNDDYTASLENRKLYQIIADPDAEKNHQIRVIDEPGEYYLFPEGYFISVTLPRATEKAIIQAA